jgi:hypothetical protein
MELVGYSIHECVFSPHECHALASELSRRIKPRQRAGARHLMSNDYVARFASDPRLLKIASFTLGDSPLPYRVTLFEKSGRANWLVAWHQDTALPLESRFESKDWGPWSKKSGILYAHDRVSDDAPGDFMQSTPSVRIGLGKHL